jgi:hypothetical protein
MASESETRRKKQMQPVTDEVIEVKPTRKNKPRVGRSVAVGDVEVHRSGNGRYQGEFMLITRQQLDGRTRAAHLYDLARDEIIKDLGGEDQLNGVQRQLVDAFVGASLVVQDMSTRAMFGEAIDVERLSNAMSTLLRLSRKLGVSDAVKKNMVPRADEYVAKVQSEEAAA